MKRSTGEKTAAKSYSIFQREKAMSGLEFSALSSAMGMIGCGGQTDGDHPGLQLRRADGQVQQGRMMSSTVFGMSPLAHVENFADGVQS